MVSNFPLSFGTKNKSAQQRDVQKSPPKKTYAVQFNVYLPPIFKIDLEEFGHENFNVGIVTNLTGFKLKKMQHLPIKPFENNGYLVSGKLEFPLESFTFEYKYALSFNEKSSETSYLIEFLNSGKNRKFCLDNRNQSITNIYDALMLPPDQATENIITKVKNTVKKFVGGTYYDESFYEEYKNETIKAMFHEIRTNDRIKFKTLDSTMCYLNDVIQGLKKTFKGSNILQVSLIFLKSFLNFFYDVFDIHNLESLSVISG